MSGFREMRQCRAAEYWLTLQAGLGLLLGDFQKHTLSNNVGHCVCVALCEDETMPTLDHSARAQAGLGLLGGFQKHILSNNVGHCICVALCES